MHDVIVVGAGPAGCLTAAKLSKNHDVLVLEDHAVSGLPTQCAGLVSDTVLTLSGQSPDILNRIFAADVIFPNGGKISLRSDKKILNVIDRAQLDLMLAESAMDSGAEIRYGEKCTGHTISDEKVMVNTESSGYDCEILVGADGPKSKIAKSLGNNNPREYLHGMQYDVKAESSEEDRMVLRIGSEIAPGFFSWEVPMGDTIRVGLCISESYGTPAKYLKRLMSIAGYDSEKIIKSYCGLIPIGGRRTTYGNRTLLVGDAAGQVKPISGGGLKPAFTSIPALCNTVSDALFSGNTSEKTLSSYERAWKKAVGKELKTGYSIRKMYTKLADADLNRVFDIMNTECIRNELTHIDVDNPSDMAGAVLKHPLTCAKLIPLMMKGIL